MYDRFVLLKTLIALAGVERIAVPEDLRRLVEMVYDGVVPDAEECARAGLDSDDLEAARQRSGHRAEAQESWADYYMLPQPYRHRPLETGGHTWDELELDQNENVTARARLSEPSVQVLLIEERSDLWPADPEGGLQARRLMELLRHRVSITHRPLVRHLVERQGEGSFGKRGPLRGYYVLRLDEGGEYRWSDDQRAYVLRLDYELGVVIRHEE